MPYGETRIVLTWGSTPSDLDSHITGPDQNGGCFHIFFGNRSYSSNDTSVNLDHDDTSSFGPETVTISKQKSGSVYRYSVHDYSCSSPNNKYSSKSNAQVNVYRGDQLLATFNVPVNFSGNVWTVFEMKDDQIIPINKMYDCYYNSIN